MSSHFPQPPSLSRDSVSTFSVKCLRNPTSAPNFIQFLQDFTDFNSLREISSLHHYYRRWLSLDIYVFRPLRDLHQHIPYLPPSNPRASASSEFRVFTITLVGSVLMSFRVSYEKSDSVVTNLPDHTLLTSNNGSL